MNADTIKPSEYLAAKLREYGASALADQFEDCEQGTLPMELHEYNEAGDCIGVTMHNIHADMIEDFEDADIPQLGFKFLP